MRFRGQQRGLAMIEVGLAIIVMSVSMLGISMLLARSAREMRSAVFMGRAAQLASDIAERMQANPAGLAAGAYLQTGTYAVRSTRSAITTPTCGGPFALPPNTAVSLPACSTASDIAAYDLALWSAQVQTSLSAGASIVVQGPTPSSRTIVVAWSEPVIDKSGRSFKPLVDAGCAQGAAKALAATAGVRCYTLDFRP